LQAPWSAEKVELDTARRRIDFELTCKAKRLLTGLTIGSARIIREPRSD
jgi:hypothetical protein